MKRKAPYMHKDGSDCYTKNCAIDHAQTIEQINKASYDKLLEQMDAIENERVAALQRIGAPVDKSFDTSILNTDKNTTKQVHDSILLNASSTSVVPNNNGTGTFPDTVEFEGTKYYKADNHRFAGDVYSMRIQFAQPITDEQMNQAAGLMGYNYRTTIAGESIGEPIRDTPYSFIVAADTTKSRRDDVGLAFEQFEGQLELYIKNGSPVRRTNQAGPNTRGTRAINGLGEGQSFALYYDDGIDL